MSETENVNKLVRYPLLPDRGAALYDAMEMVNPVKKLFVIILFSITISGFSQNKKENIYSGGMLILQPGYIITENRHQNICNTGFGIGGILRFYFYEHLTAGIYGGTLRTEYNSANSGNSFISLGYGGPFLGLTRKAGKFRYSVSVFTGKGTIKNLHIENQNNNTLTEAYLYKHSAMVFSPLLSLDYGLSQRVHLTSQLVCLTAKYDTNRVLYNPVMQLGILFNR